MESTSFYITLPSNASMDYYSNNTASCYQIRLPRTLYLKGKYEVALAEIQYPHTWPTFNEKEAYRFKYANDQGVEKHIHIAEGFYKSMHDLINELNFAVGPDFADVSFIYDDVTGRVKLHLKEGYVISFNRAFAELLGFEYVRSYDRAGWGPYLADVKRGFTSLYVYCSICESQIVGDAHVPLLRTVYVEGEHGQIINTIFDSPHYVPVNTSKFDTIEINIKNDMNELVSFTTGKVLCKLHFRQKAL